MRQQLGYVRVYTSTQLSCVFLFMNNASSNNVYVNITHKLATSQSAPRTTYYRFMEGQRSVRLVASSETDFCAVLAVQNYSVTLKFTYDFSFFSCLVNYFFYLFY